MSLFKSRKLDPFTQSSADGVSFRIRDGAGSVASLTQTALSSNWSISPITGLKGWYDATSPHGPTDAASAWEVAHRLNEVDGIESAAPNLTVVVGVGDDDGENAPADNTAAELESFGSDDTYDEDQFDWSLQMVEADAAWQYSELAGRPSRGEGVKVAHPDSGYIPHPELGDNFMAPGIDFVDSDDNAANDYGHHGLGTASVIMSQDNRASKPQSVTGIAPKASLLPMRVADKNVIHPAVLFCTGVKRLRRAIVRAIEENCHVISMSLGWFGNDALHAAIQEAYEADIIMIAASGNYVGMVVWPAAYPETIAIAGCNAKRRRWMWSSRGKRIDVTGPAKNVWVASTEGGNIRQSSGTSQATATTAGIAALWLAHHGRDNLLAKYKGKRKLTDVFRHCIRVSSDDPPRNNGRWGSGIVNAYGCLKCPLPESHNLLEAFGVADSAVAKTGVAAAFDDIDEAQLNARLAKSLGLDVGQLNALPASKAAELHARLLTDAALRERVLNNDGGVGNHSAPAALEGFGGAATTTPPKPALAGLSPSLAAALLSTSSAPS